MEHLYIRKKESLFWPIKYMISLFRYFYNKKKLKSGSFLICLCQPCYRISLINFFHFNLIKRSEKQGVITYSKDRENEVSKMFMQRKRNGIINNREICMIAQSLFSSHVFFHVAFVKFLMTPRYFPEVHRF